MAQSSETASSGAKAFAQRDNLVPTAGSRRRSCFAGRGSKARPCRHRPQRLNQRHQHVEGAAAEPYGRPSATIPKRPNSSIAGGVGEAMIVIYIYEENHRFSN